MLAIEGRDDVYTIARHGDAEEIDAIACFGPEVNISIEVGVITDQDLP